MEEKINAWKAKYGQIKEIVPDKQTEEQFDAKTGKSQEVVTDPGKVAYLRKPDRATIKYAMSKQVKSSGDLDTISAGEIVLNKCWLGGDEEIRTDDKYFFRACIEASMYLNEVMGFL